MQIKYCGYTGNLTFDYYKGWKATKTISVTKCLALSFICIQAKNRSAVYTYFCLDSSSPLAIRNLSVWGSKDPFIRYKRTATDPRNVAMTSPHNMSRNVAIIFKIDLNKRSLKSNSRTHMTVFLCHCQHLSNAAVFQTINSVSICTTWPAFQT